MNRVLFVFSGGLKVRLKNKITWMEIYKIVPGMKRTSLCVLFYIPWYVIRW
jgi:hypothetical protein